MFMENILCRVMALIERFQPLVAAEMLLWAGLLSLWGAAALWLSRRATPPRLALRDDDACPPRPSVAQNGARSCRPRNIPTTMIRASRVRAAQRTSTFSASRARPAPAFTFDTFDDYRHARWRRRLRATEPRRLLLTMLRHGLRQTLDAARCLPCAFRHYFIDAPCHAPPICHHTERPHY